MTLYKGTTPIAGLSTNKIVTGFNILDCKWSDHIINDIQWLRADTFSWQSGDVYTTAYNKLVEEYATGTEETEGSITFKRTTNGFKIATADYETAILNKYNTDGIAWYYILDTENRRFKLPRTKFGFEGLRTNVGDDIAESLPNISGNFDPAIISSHENYVSGAFRATYNRPEANHGIATMSVKGPWGFDFDASRSSSTYQNNAPVQERATQMYLYFYVGEYAQTAIEQTAGINSELFNNKVDTNLGNISSTGNAYMVNQCMPDYSQQIYPSTTMVAGTLIQVPKDSFVVVWGGDVYIENYSVFVTDDTSNPRKYLVGKRYDDTNANTQWTSFSFPVPKGWYFTCTAEQGFEYRIFPYKGAN